MAQHGMIQVTSNSPQRIPDTTSADMTRETRQFHVYQQNDQQPSGVAYIRVSDESIQSAGIPLKSEERISIDHHNDLWIVCPNATQSLPYYVWYLITSGPTS